MKSGAVATQGSQGAVPHRDPLEVSLDAVPGNLDAGDDFASFRELVVRKEGVAVVLCCSEQRASSEKALGVFMLVYCECVARGQGKASQSPGQHHSIRDHCTSQPASNTGSSSEDDPRILPEPMVATIQLLG